MSETEPTRPSSDGYERSDLSFRMAAVAWLILAGTLGGVALVAAWMIHWFAPPQRNAGISPSVPMEIGKLPPAPRLEVQTSEELTALRRREDDTLTHYGWVDKKQGVVRIPIDRAMDLTAARGLPARNTRKEDTP